MQNLFLQGGNDLCHFRHSHQRHSPCLPSVGEGVKMGVLAEVDYPYFLPPPSRFPFDPPAITPSHESILLIKGLSHLHLSSLCRPNEAYRAGTSLVACGCRLDGLSQQASSFPLMSR